MKTVKIEIKGAVLNIEECPKGVEILVTEKDNHETFKAVGLTEKGKYKIVDWVGEE
jgi:hypothetical protein